MLGCAVCKGSIGQQAPSRACSISVRTSAEVDVSCVTPAPPTSHFVPKVLQAAANISSICIMTLQYTTIIPLVRQMTRVLWCNVALAFGVLTSAAALVKAPAGEGAPGLHRLTAWCTQQRFLRANTALERPK